MQDGWSPSAWLRIDSAIPIIQNAAKINWDDGYRRGAFTHPTRTRRDVAMLRIKGASKETAPREVQEVFAAQEKQYGTILNTAKVYGLRPTIQQGVQALQAGIVASGLIGAELRHLLCMKAASINGCPY
jgi:hypothetical protein